MSHWGTKACGPLWKNMVSNVRSQRCKLVKTGICYKSLARQVLLMGSKQI